MKPCLLVHPDPQRKMDAPDGYGESVAMDAANGNPIRDVLVIGRDPNGFIDLSLWLQSQGMPVRHVAEISVFERIATGIEATPGLLFVDVDTVASLDGLIDRLLHLRRAKPALPVILSSVDFGRDDFDLSRISICDASVAWPVTFSRSEIAITMAGANNRIWQEQCGSLDVSLN
jgi:hypothetical protein